MSRFVLDMSQAVVNRTAMYTISHDTKSAFHSEIAALQYFGRTVPSVPSDSTLLSYRDADLGRVLGNPDASRGAAVVRHGRWQSTPRLFLDPLYTLFDEVRADDVVMVLDMSTVTTPAWHQPAVARAYSHAFDRLSAVRPRVLSISHNTALTLRVNYGYPSSLIDVVPLYVPRHLRQEAPPAPLADEAAEAVPFVLFVGSLETRKNLIGAIRSFDLSGLGRKGLRLVVVGGHGHGADAIRDAASTVKGVVFAGYLSDRELHALYRRARAFLYPSYLEGFGVPLLEAMYFGVPAVASHTGACPEVGGDLLTYFDPDDHASFAAELQRLVDLDDGERAAFARQARNRVDRLFTFDRYAAAVRRALGRAGMLDEEELA